MNKYTITFFQKCTYCMEISAKNEEEAEEKFWEKLENLGNKELEKLLSDADDFELESLE